LVLMDHLNIPKISVIGWPDGAIIGVQFAMNSSFRDDRMFAFGGSYSPDNSNTTIDDAPT
ncbi:hypothetical protein DOTSEDRAFT_139351, partial [Dothistroma septosporum NZE10]